MQAAKGAKKCRFCPWWPWPLTFTFKLLQARNEARFPCEFGANPFSGSRFSCTNKKPQTDGAKNRTFRSSLRVANSDRLINSTKLCQSVAVLLSSHYWPWKWKHCYFATEAASSAFLVYIVKVKWWISYCNRGSALVDVIGWHAVHELEWAEGVKNIMPPLSCWHGTHAQFFFNQVHMSWCRLNLKALTTSRQKWHTVLILFWYTDRTVPCFSNILVFVFRYFSSFCFFLFLVLHSRLRWLLPAFEHTYTR